MDELLRSQGDLLLRLRFSKTVIRTKGISFWGRKSKSHFGDALSSKFSASVFSQGADLHSIVTSVFTYFALVVQWSSCARCVRPLRERNLSRPEAHRVFSPLFKPLRSIVLKLACCWTSQTSLWINVDVVLIWEPVCETCH